jgi:hypothetical protein
MVPADYKVAVPDEYKGLPQLQVCVYVCTYHFNFRSMCAELIQDANGRNPVPLRILETGAWRLVEDRVIARDLGRYV